MSNFRRFLDRHPYLHALLTLWVVAVEAEASALDKLDGRR